MKVHILFIKRTLNFDLEEYTSVEVLKNLIKRSLNLPLNQQRLFIQFHNQKLVLKENISLKSFQKYSQNGVLEITLKNLGLQIGYRTFYYLEYAGPLSLFLFFYILKYIIKGLRNYDIIVTVLVFFHYVKRLLESHFVHIFSRPSAPIAGIIKNLIGYWVIFGIGIPLEIFFIRNIQPFSNSWNFFMITGFFLSELGNLYSHIQLMNLRVFYKNNQRMIHSKRMMPTGLFFDQVISPNYSFEIMSWIFFIGYSQSLVTLLFICLGGYIMYVWAVGKKKKLLEAEHLSEKQKDVVKKRFTLFPYIL